MKFVYIVIHGGWPDAVFNTEEGANRYVEKERNAELERAKVANRTPKEVSYFVHEAMVDNYVQETEEKGKTK